MATGPAARRGVPRGAGDRGSGRWRLRGAPAPRARGPGRGARGRGGGRGAPASTSAYLPLTPSAGRVRTSTRAAGGCRVRVPRARVRPRGSSDNHYTNLFVIDGSVECFVVIRGFADVNVNRIGRWVASNGIER